MRKIGNVLESIVVVAILLVLVHTFLEDYSVLAGWPVDSRRWIIWTGLGFDLFFTIEFLTRLYLAVSNREGAEYFFRQRGWIDFFASIPLLLLNSLPNVLALMAGAGLVTGMGSFLNILKVIKAVRIARILRLMRVVKLFRNIRYARSPLAQHHIALITTIAVAVLVFWMLGASALETLNVFPGLQSAYRDGQVTRARAIAEQGTGIPALQQRAAGMAALDPSILVVRPEGGKAVWSRYDAEYLARNFLAGDYGYLSVDGVEIFLDERPAVKAAAWEALVFFVAIVLIVLAYLFLYAPRFALGISDPVHVMKRGLAESDYNLEVKIPARNADDDVYELARLYNTVFLPLKDREGSSGEIPGSSLALDDVKNLVEK
jgi:hypothetical protein